MAQRLELSQSSLERNKVTENDRKRRVIISLYVFKLEKKQTYVLFSMLVKKNKRKNTTSLQIYHILCKTC